MLVSNIFLKTSFKNHHVWKLENIYKKAVIRYIEEKYISYNYFFKVFLNERLYVSYFNFKYYKNGLLIMWTMVKNMKNIWNYDKI